MPLYVGDRMQRLTGKQLTPAQKELIIESFSAFNDTLATFRIERDNPYTVYYIEEGIGYVAGVELAGELEILRCYISPAYRGQGYGYQLLRCVLEQSTLERCFLEVRVSNQRARSLYERVGFVTLGVRRNYYKNPNEDAIMMEWSEANYDNKTNFSH